jgi:hypothetical protein
MKKRLIAGIALGGAALFAVPAGVAYAISAGGDSRPGVFNGFGSHGMQSRGNGGTNAPDSAPRSNDQSGMGMMDNTRGGTRGAMQGGMMDNTRGGTRGGMQGGMMGGMQGGMHTTSTAHDPAALVAPGSTLTADETSSLTYMVEEEKLAHDLYVELGDAWDLRVFVNTAGAETQHVDEIRSLLDAYGVADPTAGMGAGAFVNPTLQGLYDSLLAKGLTSSTDALEVGALVEETDIADLRDRTSTNVAIDQVFGQLETGSDNHLRAFTTNLDRLGVSYDAQVLSPADVARIIGQ